MCVLMLTSVAVHAVTPFTFQPVSTENVSLLVWAVPTCPLSPATSCWGFAAPSDVLSHLAGQPPLREKRGTELTDSTGMHDGGFKALDLGPCLSKTVATKAQNLLWAKIHLSLISRTQPHACSQPHARCWRCKDK